MGAYFIVGGSSGIGKSIQEKLSSEGHQVYSTYFKNEDHCSKDHYYALDVTSEDLDLTFLPDSLDGVVYCPGAIDLKPFTRLKTVDIQADITHDLPAFVALGQVLGFQYGHYYCAC